MKIKRKGKISLNTFEVDSMGVVYTICDEILSKSKDKDYIRCAQDLKTNLFILYNSIDIYAEQASKK